MKTAGFATEEGVAPAHTGSAVQFVAPTRVWLPVRPANCMVSLGYYSEGRFLIRWRTHRLIIACILW